MTHKVVVAMSGGVDSSVVAAMMLREGYDVIGVTLRMFDNESTNLMIDDAKKVAAFLGIEHHEVDCRSEFKIEVEEYFKNLYMSGKTPSPCVMCNPGVKFATLDKFLDRVGGDKIATGHYVNLKLNGKVVTLAMADDLSKDQSYFLYRVPRKILAKCIFPLGQFFKTSETRKFATEIGLPVAQKSDSQDVCFSKTDWYKEFFSTCQSGNILSENGQILGCHNGVKNYTIGQRKGLGLSGGPYFVKSIDCCSNCLTVCQKRPETREIFLDDIVWLNDEYSGECYAKIRSQNAPIACIVERNKVTLSKPDCAAPGQHCVLYNEKSEVLGGGVIMGF